MYNHVYFHINTMFTLKYTFRYWNIYNICIERDIAVIKLSELLFSLIIQGKLLFSLILLLSACYRNATLEMVLNITKPKNKAKS